MQCVWITGYVIESIQNFLILNEPIVCNQVCSEQCPPKKQIEGLSVWPIGGVAEFAKYQLKDFSLSLQICCLLYLSELQSNNNKRFSNKLENKISL